MSVNLAVGLGNSESRYALTRHNAGAIVLERLAKSCGVECMRFDKYANAYLAGGSIAGRAACLRLCGRVHERERPGACENPAAVEGRHFVGRGDIRRHHHRRRQDEALKGRVLGRPQRRSRHNGILRKFVCPRPHRRRAPRRTSGWTWRIMSSGSFPNPTSRRYPLFRFANVFRCSSPRDWRPRRTKSTAERAPSAANRAETPAPDGAGGFPAPPEADSPGGTRKQFKQT